MSFIPPTFIHFDDILYYDGSLLSIGLTNDHQIMLQVFCDCDENFNYYVNVLISKKEIEQFLESKLSYYDVLKFCTNVQSFKSNNQGFHSWIDMSVSDFITNYGPQPDSNLFVNTVVNDTFISTWKTYLDLKD